MIECKELANKVIGVFAIYEDGQYGPEVQIEFTDGTAFSACVQNQVSIEAKHIDRHGDKLWHSSRKSVHGVLRAMV